MKTGTVLGQVALRARAPGYEDVVFQQVRVDDGILVAADLTGVKPGELVLLTQGPSADGYRMELRCDALIVGTVGEL